MAIVYLANGKSISVNESVDQIQDAITDLGSATTPMIRLTELGSNQPALVFAANIVSIQDLG